MRFPNFQYEIEPLVFYPNYVFYDSKNVLFEEGEVVKIYYVKKSPKKATLASPQYFYRNHPIVNVIYTVL